MLKIMANIYGNDKESFDEIGRTLENEGYSIAYQNELSGIVVKEVDNLESEDPTA